MSKNQGAPDRTPCGECGEPNPDWVDIFARHKSSTRFSGDRRDPPCLAVVFSRLRRTELRDRYRFQLMKPCGELYLMATLVRCRPRGSAGRLQGRQAPLYRVGRYDHMASVGGFCRPHRHRSAKSNVRFRVLESIDSGLKRHRFAASIALGSSNGWPEVAKTPRTSPVAGSRLSCSSTLPSMGNALARGGYIGVTK